MNKTTNSLWGIILIILGLILALNALEITNINLFFNGWWTLFIIIPSFIDLFKDKDKTGNIIGLVIGLFLLLACNDIIDFTLIFKLIIPIALIITGISFIYKDNFSSKIKDKIKELNKNIDNEYYATFSEQKLEFNKDEFKDCKLNAIFGGIKCDLKDVVIKKDIVINASAIFGGITIYLPDNINVKVVGTSIFGGVTDERKNKTKDNELTIYINTLCLFGGINLK